MSKLSYDEFSFNNRIYSIDVLNKEAEENDGNIGVYKGKIFCPACKKAHLSYTNKTSKRSSFLSAINVDEHLKGCAYSYPPLNKRDAISIFRGYTDNEIKDKTNALMRMLCKDNNEKATNTERDDVSNHPLKVKNASKGNSYNHLRKKSLNKVNDEIKTGDPYAFYGKKVKLRAKEKKNKNNSSTYHLLEVVLEKMSFEIYYFVNPKDIDVDSVYNIVCIGYFNKYKKIQPISSQKSAVMFKVVQDE